MEAPRMTAALGAVLALIVSLVCTPSAHAASARSQNFIVSAATPALAKELCEAAETQRRELAIEWLGQELPPWQQPCPIEAKIHPQLGAGGATQFSFSRSGMPFGWVMSVQGSRERVLDSVLPHEITHTIFATHFGRPLPRWADEGACTTVEHTSEKTKQERFLVEFLMTERGIPFNKMFAMKEYPADMLPLYAQGYSLARYLIMQGGKHKFVQYVGEGMQTENWPAATKKYYGHKDLSDLQVTWLGWVQAGSPKLQPIDRSIERGEMMIATNDPRGAGQSTAQSAAANSAVVASPVTHAASQAGGGVPSQVIPAHALVTRDNAAATKPTKQAHPGYNANTISPPRPEFNLAANTAPPLESNVARPNSDGGWYARRRDEVRQQVNNPAEIDPNRPQVAPPAPAPVMPQPSANLPARDNRRVMLEWSRPVDQPWSPASRATDVAQTSATTDQLTRRKIASDGNATAWR